jgi:uncharacterized protein (DUF58 family)
MLSEVWLLFVGAAFVLSAALRHSGLLLITLLVATATALAWLWDRWVLRRVQYTRELTASRAFAGERVQVSVTVTNRNPYAVCRQLL